MPATPEALTCCPLCGSTNLVDLFLAHDRLHRLPGVFGLVQCRCGMVLLSPRPPLECLRFYYPEEDYYSFSVGASAETVRVRPLLGRIRDLIRESALAARGYPVAHLGWPHRLLRPLAGGPLAGPALYAMAHRFPAYRPGGRALDIGCGNGSYLSYLKRHGWEVAGVEVSHKAAKVARERFGIPVHVGDLSTAGFASHSFDFVHLSHVIEHVPDPVGMLDGVRTLLKPGGFAYLETPNVRSFGAATCRQRWLHYDPPRHLCLFNPETLGLALRCAGLHVRRLWTVVDPQVFRWEDTFTAEELSGTKLQPRPYLRLNRIPRAFINCVISRLVHFTHPMTGDILCCEMEPAT